MKLGRKLILSGAALAACATTLVTSTYAWYVSNANAKVSNITGSTAEASATGNLFVAHSNAAGTDQDGEYSPSIDFATKGAKSLNELTPVTYIAATDSTEAAWKDKFNVDVTSGQYSEYKFWLWSTDEDTVNVDFTVENTTGTLPTQTVYSNVGTGVEAGGTLSVDAIYALRMSVTIGDLGEKVYDVAGAAGYTANTPNTALNAHSYYKQVAGTDPLGGTTELAGLTSMDTWTVTKSATEGQLVTLRFWLEGTDKHCFDACAGQTFKFSFNFSIADSDTDTGSGA